MGHRSSSALELALLLLGWVCATDAFEPAVNNTAAPCFRYEHCLSSPHGVHDLDCFMEISTHFQCVWKSGNQSSGNTLYTLIIEQPDRKFCDIHKIHRTSHNIPLFRKQSMVTYVVEMSNDGSNCTKAVFRGHPQDLVRCSPTKSIHFKRHSRRLEVLPPWKERNVEQYVVRYREQQSLSWNESTQILKGQSWTEGNLTPSVSYEVQIQCVRNKHCLQCPWSEIFLIPMELTAKPVTEKLEVVPQRNGTRLIGIEWTLDPKEVADGYIVTVSKASGEFAQVVNTTLPQTRITLSGSAFNISIEALNSAGSSPKALINIPPVDGDDLAGTLNVTLGGKTNFVVSWNSSLIKSYWCYSVEWWTTGELPSFHSFHQNKHNSAKIQLKGPLQPYRRYVFLLHVRLDKNTCNLKHINSSEGTFGRAEAYIKEGTPLSPPLNITHLRPTRNSVDIKWTSIPEEDLRGFLLGYKIYYSEEGQENQVLNVTLSPKENTYTLSNLKERAIYRISMSAFTAAGEGVQSAPMYLNFVPPGDWKLPGAILGISGGIICFFLMAHLCNPLLRRAKVLFWPSIPNPGNSSAIQKIDGVLNQEVLEPIIGGTMAQMKEDDASSLLIIEDQGTSEPTWSSSQLLVQDTENLSPASLPNEVECEASSRELAPTLMLTSSHNLRTTTSIPCVSDYTTMELFQQATALRAVNQQPPPPLLRVRATQPEDEGQMKAKKDYVQQSVSPKVILYLDSTGEGKVSIL